MIFSSQRSIEHKSRVHFPVITSTEIENNFLLYRVSLSNGLTQTRTHFLVVRFKLDFYWVLNSQIKQGISEIVKVRNQWNFESIDTHLIISMKVTKNVWKRFILIILINRYQFEVFKILRTDATTCFGSMCNSWWTINRHAFEKTSLGKEPFESTFFLNSFSQGDSHLFFRLPVERRVSPPSVDPKLWTRKHIFIEKLYQVCHSM